MVEAASVRPSCAECVGRPSPGFGSPSSMPQLHTMNTGGHKHHGSFGKSLATRTSTILSRTTACVNYLKY